MSVELESVKLKKLFDKKKGGLTQAKFGEMFAIGSQGVVCHYLNGRLLLNVEVAKKFAKGLNITVRDFSPRLADEIENGVGEETFRVPVTIMIRPELRGKMLKVLADRKCRPGKVTLYEVYEEAIEAFVKTEK